MSSFNELVGELTHGAPLEIDGEDEDNRDEAPDSAPTEESPEEQDKPTPDPTDEPEDQPDEDLTGEEAEPEGGDEEASAEDEDKEPTVEIDGEEVPLSKVKEWRDRGLMRDDYSRKTQQLAQEREQMQELVRSQRKLVNEVTSDPYLSKFIAAHPDALQILLESPEDTRGLLNDKEAVNAFWEDYELISDNPRLADRLTKASEDEVEEVSAEVQYQRAINSAAQVAAGLQHVVEEVGKEYEGVDAEAVESWLLELGGLDPNRAKNGEAGPDEVVPAMATLYQMLYRTQNGELMIDPRIIRDRFELLSSRVESTESKKRSSEDEHNRKVDEQLSGSEGRPPTTAGKGSAPTAGTERVDMPDDFRSAIDDILGH